MSLTSLVPLVLFLSSCFLTHRLSNPRRAAHLIINTLIACIKIAKFILQLYVSLITLYLAYLHTSNLFQSAITLPARTTNHILGDLYTIFADRPSPPAAITSDHHAIPSAKLVLIQCGGQTQAGLQCTRERNRPAGST